MDGHSSATKSTTWVLLSRTWAVAHGPQWSDDGLWSATSMHGSQVSPVPLSTMWVVTRTGASISSLSMVLFWNLSCVQYVHVHLLINFPIHLLSDFQLSIQWINGKNDSMLLFEYTIWSSCQWIHGRRNFKFSLLCKHTDPGRIL
jgi:hypothetical protein